MRGSIWRGSTAFRGRSPHQLLAVGFVVVAFVVVAAWNIGDAGFSHYYGAAARSMSSNWNAFFFGSFDPAATITLDKLSGFLVPQAISASAFGFHAWALALPEVVEGSVTIVASYVIAARWRGWPVGMIAVVATATTPLLASMFGHPMEDSLLTMSLALALLFWQSWLLSDRMLPFVFSALWVAVGFQAKMMQAWLIVPALVIGILLVGSASPVARLRRAALFTAIVLAASVLWMTVVQLIPAGSRPYFDGSTNNNIFSTVFAFNGLNRLFPNLLPGAAAHPPNAVLTGSAGPGPDASSLNLLLPVYTTQVGWLVPLAIAGTILIALRVFGSQRGRREADAIFGAVVATWLLTSATFLTLVRIPHTAYLAAISVQVAIVAGFAVVTLARCWQSGDKRARRIVVGVAAAQAGWVVTLLVLTNVAPTWLVVFVVATSVLSVALIVLRGTLRGWWATDRALAVLVCAAIVACPTVWTLATLDPLLDGSAVDAYAGPQLAGYPGDPSRLSTSPDQSSFEHFAIALPVLSAEDPRLDRVDTRFVAHVRRRVVAGNFLLATDSWARSASFILGGGYSVLTIGGYSGALATPTLAQFESLVRSGPLRFVVLGPDLADTGHSATRTDITQWVRSQCRLIRPPGVATGAGSKELWDCDQPPRS
jgi:4-amino-4-deoxy-L-arabinose transferase-like glycosyltransferase